MANGTHPARKGKESEGSGSKKKRNGNGRKESSTSVSGSVSGDTSRLRRSSRETPSRKTQNNSNSSPARVRKSQRLEKQTPPTTPSSTKKKTPTKMPLRRSERENKFQSSSSRKTEKGATSKGLKDKGSNSPTSKDIKEKEDQSLKELVEEAKGVTQLEKQDSKVGIKRKKRLDARHYRDMFKPQKKKTKVSDSPKKRRLEDCDDSGDSGSDKVEEGQEQHDDGEESKGYCIRNIDVDTEGSDSDVKEKLGVKPCESEDCFPAEKLQNGEIHLAPNKLSDDGNGLISNEKGETPREPAVGSEGTVPYNVDIVPSPSLLGTMTISTEVCRKCFKKQRLPYDSPKLELCCCISNSMRDMDMISVSKDRGKCGTCVTAQFAEKHGGSIWQSVPPADDEQNTCATCKHAGKLLHCGGKGCKRSFHPSCLSTSEENVHLPIWYCSDCSKKRLVLGVHSVSEGIESVWDVRESNSEGAQKQKQCFVKYKGLAHIHNHWVPEVQLLYEAPKLLSELGERKEDTQWKPEWAVPHRLLQKRSLIADDHLDKHLVQSPGTASDAQHEWLVKWHGLDYDQATWELEDSSCFRTPKAQQLIRDYETRHDRARKTPLSKGNEIQERKKGSHVKLGRLSGGGLCGADNIYLNSVNKLREYYHKGHNGILFVEQDRVAKVIYLVSSLVTNAGRPFLIITPSASLSLWEAEFLRLAASLNVVVYGGSKDARKIIRSLEFYDEGGYIMIQVLLSSIEAISEDLEVLKGLGWEAIIIDDCQKSSILAQSSCIKKLATNWMLMLMNTQLKETVDDYVNILCLLKPGDNSDENPGIMADSGEDINVLKERLSSFIICARFIEYWVPVQISNLQLEHYCRTILSNSTALRSCSKSDPVGSLREILISTRKCCDHPYVTDQSLQASLTEGLPPAAVLDIGIKASGKLHLLDGILSELRNQELKVLILYQSIGSGRDSTGDILDDFLRLRFGLDAYEHVDGGCVSAKKQAALNKFNKERERSFFLLETRACLPSIKLSKVDAVIIFDSDWNPLNDMRALQKITIDAKIELIKVFRLYCSCTVEERVLILAKKGMILDSTLQGISPSTSHMLLMWGSSYLFNKLDEFHCDNLPDQRENIVPGYSFLKDVCEEIMSLIKTNENITLSKFISLARQSGVSYLKDTPLVGEQKIQLEDGVPPHVFWSKLLEGKQPQWKYLSGSSQRNRKRVHYFDESPSQIQIDETAKKRKKMDSTKLDSCTQQLGANLEKSNAGDKDRQGRAPISNSESSRPTLPIVTVPGAPDVKMLESGGIKNLYTEQKGLLPILKPAILGLCESLLLKDDVKNLAERFLEYVVNNHRVIREPETILQAFQISVCWTAAAVLNQKIDHKKSLATARENLNFNCREDEADFIYSKMKLLMRIFLLRTENIKIPNSSDSPSATNSMARGLEENCVESPVSHIQTSAVMSGESPPGVDFLDKQVLSPVQMTDKEKDIARQIKKVKKKCEKHMETLKEKQNEELEKFEKSSTEKRAVLEKQYRAEFAIVRSIYANSSVLVDWLKILDRNFAKKREDLESEISICRKELEATQQAERDGEQKKTAKWLEQVKCWAQAELADKPPSANGGQSQSAEQNGRPNHSNGAACIVRKLLEVQNNDGETTGTHEPEMAPIVPEVAQSSEKIVTSQSPSLVTDKTRVNCQTDANMNFSENVQTPEGAGSKELAGELCHLVDLRSVLPAEPVLDNQGQVDPLEQPPAASVGEMETYTKHMDSLVVDISTTCATNQVNGAGTALVCNSTEPLSIPVSSFMEQPTADPTSMCPLPMSQVLGDESCERLVDGGEEYLQYGTEIHNRTLQESITPLDYNSTRIGSSGRLDNELTEVDASLRGTIQTQQEGNGVNTSGEPFSGPLPDLAVDANLGEIHTSVTRGTFLAYPSRLNPIQRPTHTISRFPPPLASDPLQNELERLRKEIDQTVNIHEETKLRLNSECQKEIEETVAKIRSKYDGKLKETEASFSLKKNELEMNQNKVMMNKILAEAFRSKCVEYRAAPGMQQAMSSLEHLSQPQPATRPSPNAGSVTVLPRAATQHGASPSVLATVHPSSVLPSSTPVRAPHHQVRSEIRAPPSRLQSFGSAPASLPMPSSILPSAHNSLLGPQPPGNTPPSSSAPPQLPPRPPQPPPFAPPALPNSQEQPHQAESSERTQALNLSMPAMDLLMDIGRRNEANLRRLVSNLPSVIDNALNFEPRVVAANGQPPSASLGARNDVICLSDDE